MPTELFIFDSQGNSLWQGVSDQSLVGLQCGETFWFGTLSNRTWVKILSIAVGVRSDTAAHVVEIVVEPSQQQTTRTSDKVRLIDHGEMIIKEEYGGSGSLNARGIIVTSGKISGGGIVQTMTVQMDSVQGPVLKTEHDVKVGTAIQVSDEKRMVTATLVHAHYSGPLRIRVTEHVKEKP